jgi:hypothetical protein
MASQELKLRILRSKNIGDVTENGVVFEWELASSQGAAFELFREPRHTDDDIDEAKRQLHRDRDVVSLRVVRVDEDVTADLNPRYLAYCQAHNKTPERMIAFDEKHWPGGKMTGFILWSNVQLRKAHVEHPGWFLGEHLWEAKQYDRWLWMRVRHEQAMCTKQCHKIEEEK